MKVGLWFHGKLPVKRYGGTQRVVVWLADALAELGHEPVLLTPPGSRSDTARVFPVARVSIRRAERDPGFRLDPLLPDDLDVVHFHSMVVCSVDLPHLFTVHGNGEPGQFGPRCVFVSRNHMERMRGRHFVYNGISLYDYDFRARKDDHFLFLSRTGRSVKGVDRAERVARRAGRRLVVAGGWRFRLKRGIRYVGPVGGRRKRRHLAAARGLLFPIRWEEPFGLVSVEAMASGTPVLAAPRGAVPEVVTEDVGFLCETDEEFVEAMDRVDEVDPEACRRRVEERFSARRMAGDYLELYRRALEGTLTEDGP